MKGNVKKGRNGAPINKEGKDGGSQWLLEFSVQVPCVVPARGECHTQLMCDTLHSRVISNRYQHSSSLYQNTPAFLSPSMPAGLQCRGEPRCDTLVKIPAGSSQAVPTGGSKSV